jgi:hypothetical protein
MSQKKLTKVLGCCAAVFGILAFAMMFLQAVTTGGDNPTIYKGFELAFGKSLGNVEVLGQKGEIKILFSFPILLAYLLPLAAAVLFILTIVLKSKGSKFIMGCCAFACFVCGIILLVLVRQMATFESTSTILGRTSKTTWNLENCQLAIGTILAIVFSSLGACTAGSFSVIQLLNNKRK